jgi:hypothetical protein
MAKNPFAIKPMKVTGFGLSSSKPKKRTITMAEKKWLWQYKKRHICPVCHKVVNDFFDAEFDHKRAFAKGGATTPANTLITHKLCNRLKGKKSLSQIKKHLGTKRTIKSKITKKTIKKKKDSLFGVSEFKVPKFKF